MEWGPVREALRAAPPVLRGGRVTGVRGLALRIAIPRARLGEVLRIERQGQPLLVEVVGFGEEEVIALPLGDGVGVGLGDPVEVVSPTLLVPVGAGLLGRVVDGLGRPIDGRPLPNGLPQAPVDRPPPAAMERLPVHEPLPTGVRCLDAFLTLGVGQRMGLFAGSGVGKSTLLGSIARGAEADAVVVALVGERGREVGEFLRDCLGKEGLERSVVVASTSDASPLERLRAAQTATTVAEHFRDEGRRVLLLVDSVTRFARAQREVGLAAGEPPTRRGYPPSVFAALPRLLERTGQSSAGAITAIYTVLVEGDDMDEPIADEVRGILDGHLVLSRHWAAHGHYPAIAVPHSVSRCQSQVVSAEHRRWAQRLRQLIAVHEAKRDLLLLGGYQVGRDAELDAAVAAQRELEAFVCQEPSERTPFAAMLAQGALLAGKYAAQPR